jgi:hypothetical protein
VQERHAIFISHAAPEDNPFTIWLGAKLAAAGYEVWADVLRLNGGDDWQRKLEQALRVRACKVLLVANPNSVSKQGVRNEIQIASEVARKIGDSNFIIPLRLAPFEAPFLIAHAQYIDFSRGWAEGLYELFQVLQQEYKVPTQQAAPVEAWCSLQAMHGRPRLLRTISRRRMECRCADLKIQPLWLGSLALALTTRVAAGHGNSQMFVPAFAT